MVPAETKTEIESKIAGLKEVQGKDDKAVIEAKTEELSASLQKIGEIIQKAADESAKAAPTEEPVRDAEVNTEKPEEK